MGDVRGRAAPDRYPDPFGRHEKRYHDGKKWTDRVSSHGRESADAPTGEGRVPTVDRNADKVWADVVRTGGADGGALGVDTALKQDQRSFG